MTPLTEIEAINERLDCVEDLVENIEIAKRFKEKAGKLQDVERMLSKIYTYSVKAQVSFAHDDLSWNHRLSEFKRLLS
jgi:DNA mismatch repair ATPase MutS